MTAMPAAEGLVTVDITCQLGTVRALEGVSLSVSRGVVCGLLGPNGAGKTTLVRVFATLLRPSSGCARVCGHDVVVDPLAARRCLGLAGQYAAVDGELTGRENVEMVGRLYRLTPQKARARAGEILERFGLASVADRRVSTYSGGMRRRLDLCATLAGTPPVIVLDEPTTGLDPTNRHELWNIVAELRRDGTTVLLTTQYLEEADRLADQIVVLNQGRIVANGSAAALKATVGSAALTVRTAPHDAHKVAAVLAGLATTDAPTVNQITGEVRLTVVDKSLCATVVRRLDEHRLAILSLQIIEPSLDDVFLALTTPTSPPGRASTAADTSLSGAIAASAVPTSAAPASVGR